MPAWRAHSSRTVVRANGAAEPERGRIAPGGPRRDAQQRLAVVGQRLERRVRAVPLDHRELGRGGAGPTPRRASTCRSGRCAAARPRTSRFMWYSGDVISQWSPPIARRAPRRGGPPARASGRAPACRPRGSPARSNQPRTARRMRARASSVSRAAGHRAVRPRRGRGARGTAPVRVSILMTSPTLMKSGTLMRRARRDLGRLGRARRGVAAEARLGLDDRLLDEVRQRHADGAAVEEQHLDVDVLRHEVRPSRRWSPSGCCTWSYVVVSMKMNESASA